MNREEKIKAIINVLDTTSGKCIYGECLHNVAEKIVDSLESEPVYICKYSNPKCGANCRHRIPHVKDNFCDWSNPRRCSGGVAGATCIKLRD